MAVAKAFGARRILAIDVQPGRLELAKQYLGVETHVASPVVYGEEREVYSRRHVGESSVGKVVLMRVFNRLRSSNTTVGLAIEDRTGST